MIADTSSVKEGDVVQCWHDTGAFGHQHVYARVVKVCPKKLKVRWERGRVAYHFPWQFDKVVPENTVAELRQDGVDI